MSGGQTIVAQIGIILSGGIRIMIPIAFGALGCTLSERVGVINIGAEGIMLAGAFGAVVGSYYTGNAWIGVLFGLLSGVLLASVHAFLTVKLKTGQIISGLGVNMLASGVTTVLLQSIWNNRGKSDLVTGLQNIRIKGVENIPIIGAVLRSISPMLIILLIVAIVLWFWLYKTVPGLRARSIGENPRSPDSVGINVPRTQILCVIVSGAITAFGGIYLSIGDVSLFSRDMVAGRGFIALAVTILGGWKPAGVLGACLAFGIAQGMQFRLQEFSVPVQLVQMLPYVMTLLLMFFLRSSHGPAASGENFHREGE